MSIYFILSAIESIFLSLYLISIGSSESNQLLWKLSLSRLITVVFVFLLTGLFIFLAIKSILVTLKGKSLLSGFLVNRNYLLISVLASLLIAISILIFLARKPGFGGDLRNIIKQLEPLFVWLMVLVVQASFMLFVWYCAFYIINQGKKTIYAIKKELFPVFLIFIVALLLKWIIVSSSAFGPTGRGDEMTYYDMADSLIRGFFSFEQTHHYPPLYPLTFFPALIFGRYTFSLIKLINAVISTSIIFPTYFLSRNFLNIKKSLIPTMIICLIPYHLVFPRRIVSENLYFPILLWSMFLVQKKPTGKRSNLVWDIIFAATLGLLYLTRYISLPVIPMFLLAWWVRPFDMDDCIFRPSWKKIFRFGLIIFVIAAVFSPWVIGGISEGVPVKLMFGFGITARTNQDQLTAANLLMWAFLYICYIVLIAAPVLPMLIKSISLIDCRDWRGEYGRWIFQGLLLIIGFLTAAIRHSWRAYYNQHFPSQIMGRYVVYFSAPFLITFFIVLELLEKTEKTNGKLSNKILVFISFLLVSFSYYVIIEGKIINIGRSFINPIGSVEGHYVNLLGINFFFFVAFIYLVSLIKLQHGNLRISFGIIAIGLAIFLIFGWFDYYEELKARQTYPWLSREIADLVKSSIPQDYLSNGITLYIPNSLNADQRAELYNGLRVRNIDNTQIIDFREGSDLEMATNFGFIISEFPVGEEPEKLYRFGEDNFYIELVTR